MKSYTDLEQSKKLFKILPIESADMKWYFWKNEIDAPKTPTFGYSKTAAESYKNTEAVYLPCWSLSALLDILPKEIVYDKNMVFLEFHAWENSFEYVNNADYTLYVTNAYDNPVDACVDMIERLHELNLLRL